MLGLTPNERVPPGTQRYYYLAFAAIIAALWALLPSKILPTPWAIIAALPNLWAVEGFGRELWVSVALNLQAGALMALVSLLVGYSVAIPALRPLGTAFAAGRFNSFVGLPLLLTLMIADQHVIKVIILAVGMAVFSVQPIRDIIDAIPKEHYDDARALRMNEWRVTWEVVVLGTADQVFDVLRTNLGMGWMMLPMVEGIFRSEGGIGVFLLQQDKYMRLDNVYCAIWVVMLVGLGFDRLWLGLKKWIMPYAFIGREAA